MALASSGHGPFMARLAIHAHLHDLAVQIDHGIHIRLNRLQTESRNGGNQNLCVLHAGVSEVEKLRLNGMEHPGLMSESPCLVSLFQRKKPGLHQTQCFTIENTPKGK